MENVFRSALGRVSADDELIKKTRDYIRNHYADKRGTATHTLFRGNTAVRRLAAAACALLLIVGCPIGAYAYYKTPTSYLSIDINPSVELGINAFGKVVTATAYNEDGETILEGQDVVNMDVKDAVNIIITSASQRGYILEDGSTIISIISETNNDKNAEELVEDAEEGAEAAMDSAGDSAEIQKDNISLERRDDARALGITPGKLNLIQKLQELDPTITVEQYKDASVKEIQEKFTELKKAQSEDTEDDSSETEISPDMEPSPSDTPDTETPAGNGKGNNSSGNGGNNGGKKDDADENKPNGNNGNGQNKDEKDQTDQDESTADDEDVSQADIDEEKQDNGNSGGKKDSTDEGKPNGNNSQKDGESAYEYDSNDHGNNQGNASNGHKK
jgi:hypothetical protein